MNTSVISAEQRLFVGVIVNAAQEAAGVFRNGGELRTIKQSARAWFANNGEDFRTVCTLSGLEPRDVRKRVLSYVERVDRDPNELVQLKRANLTARRRGVSIHDVAKHAKVSPTTVANVLHNRPNVGAGTRARVNAAITELGYLHSVH